MIALYLSIVIKVLVLIMTIYVFILMCNERATSLGPFTHLYFLKRKYEFLKVSLLAVAGLLFFEILDSSMFIANRGTPLGANIFFSDLIAVSLSLILVKLYRIIHNTPS